MAVNPDVKGFDIANFRSQRSNDLRSPGGPSMHCVASAEFLGKAPLLVGLPLDIVLACHARDGAYDIFQAVSHFVRCESQYDQPVVLHKHITPLVVFRRLGLAVLYAIDLDYEAGFPTVKVCDIATDRVLRPKFHAELAAAKSIPDRQLRWRHGVAHFPRAAKICGGYA